MSVCVCLDPASASRAAGEGRGGGAAQAGGD